jgi:hypothetical protein
LCLWVLQRHPVLEGATKNENMKTKYQHYFHWVALGGLCVCLQVHAQTTPAQVYVKDSKNSLFLLSGNNITSISDLDKLKLTPKLFSTKFEIFGVPESNVSKVVSTTTRSDYYAPGMQLPTITYLPTKKAVIKYGAKVDTLKSDSIKDLKSFAIRDQASLFNYNETAAMTQLNANGYSYELTSDGTLHYWKNNQHTYINKTLLTYDVYFYNSTSGSYRIRRLYKKYAGNKVYPVIVVKQYFEKMFSNNQVNAMREEEEKISYPGLALATSLGGKSLMDDPSTWTIPDKSKSGSLVSSHYNKSDESISIQGNVPKEVKILGVYNMHGQKVSDAQSYDKIDKQALPNGYYKILKTVDGIIETETLIINN